jgi:hypothetical protein
LRRGGKGVRGRRKEELVLATFRHVLFPRLPRSCLEIRSPIHLITLLLLRSRSLEDFLKIKIKLSHCTKLDLRIFSSSSSSEQQNVLTCFPFNSSSLCESKQKFFCSLERGWPGWRRFVYSFAPSRSLDVILIVILIIVGLVVVLFITL